MAVTVRKSDKAGIRFGVVIEDLGYPQFRYEIFSQKCLCGSCEDLNLIFQEDDVEEKYDLYTYGNETTKDDNLITLIYTLVEELARKL